jgi:hypothetical protein
VRYARDAGDASRLFSCSREDELILLAQALRLRAVSLLAACNRSLGFRQMLKATEIRAALLDLHYLALGSHECFLSTAVSTALAGA